MAEPDATELIDRAETLPYGRAKTVLLEEAVRVVGDTDLDLAFRARLNLVSAYVHGGERGKGLVPFSWCLTEYDADPVRFAWAKHTVWWAFKWAPATLIRFPEVDLDSTMATLDEMERRYAADGHSPHPVHALRCAVANHLGDMERAAAEYRAWIASPRGPLSDCIGCDPGAKVEYLVGTGRLEEALAQALPVLDGTFSCTSQPQGILTDVLEPYARTGRLTEAADAHRRAYPHLRSRGASLGSIATHVEFCVRTGNEPRALEIVASHLHLLAKPDSPHAAMCFSAAASVTLHRSAADDATALLEGRPMTELAAELAGQARALALQFDERNRTDHQSRLIEETLAGEPWADYVPLSEQARRASTLRASRTRRTEPEEPAAPEPPTATEVATAELLDQADAARRTGDAERLTALREEFETRVPERDRTTLDQARLLEARAFELYFAAREAEEAVPALDVLLDALTLYDAAGDRDRARETRARIGRINLSLGNIAEAVAVSEQPLRELIAGGEHVSGWRLDLARLLLATDRPEEAEEQLTAARTDVEPQAAAGRAWIHGDVLLELGRPDDAIGEYRAALDAIGDGEVPVRLLWHLGRALLILGEVEAARAELIEASALLAAAGGADPWLDLDLATAYLRADQAAEAIATAEGALPAIAEAGDVGAEAWLRELLADAYRRIDSPDDALEQLAVLRQLVAEDAERAGAVDEARADLLQGLERFAEADELFAAATATCAEIPDRLRLLRKAADIADLRSDPARADRLRADAERCLDQVANEEEIHLFHRAGLALDRAYAAINRGQTAEAARHATSAENGYRFLGIPHLVAQAVLLRLHVTTDADPATVRADWETLTPGEEMWFRLGYALHDVLTTQERTQEAAALLEVLEAE